MNFHSFSHFSIVFHFSVFFLKQKSWKHQTAAQQKRCKTPLALRVTLMKPSLLGGFTTAQEGCFSTRISGQWTPKNSLCGSDSLATYRLLVPLDALKELTCSAPCNECNMTHLIHFNPVVLDQKQQKRGHMWLTDSQNISSFAQVILSKSHEAICKNLGESHPQALLVGHIIYSLYRVSKLPNEDIPI